MNKKIKLVLILCGLLCVTGCGGKKKPVDTKPTTQTTAAQKVETQKEENTENSDKERTKYVRLEVVNRGNGIEVHILDENDRRIENVSFTICIVKTEQDTLLDKNWSGTVEGEEYTDTDGDGSLYVSELVTGSYGIYLRPMDEYLYATPIPVSLVTYSIVPDISEKIQKKSSIDSSKEDKSYIEDAKLEAARREKAIKVSNIISSKQIVGESKTFKVTVPVLSEKDEVQYEKLNSKEVDSSIQIDEYIKDNNKETLLIGGVLRDVYVYEESRFDPRLEDTYVSKAILREDGKYYIYNLVPQVTTSNEEIYVGWYSRKGKHYFNDADGFPVTGWRKIDGMWYYFDENGQKASVTGLDVSEYQKEIDWEKLKEAGIDFVIIRCGFRGYGTGVLVEDERFRENIQGATAAGMPFGVYIFSQAMNQREAAEEASMILELCRGYEPTLPYAIDIEACGDSDGEGRQNGLSTDARTLVINTFVSVIESQGEEAMLYSNQSYLDHQIDMSQIHCKLWFAMWPGETDTTAPNDDALEADPTKVPDREVEIWQYSDKGQVDGIEELVDLNAWIPSLE
ncbi:MAG: GH25 family lysozyme [Lachnospiraceae bacterium]